MLVFNKLLRYFLSLAFLLLSVCSSAQVNQFVEPNSAKALADVFYLDSGAFASDISKVSDKARASFLKEYMALMVYTAANSKENYAAYISASDKAFEDVASSPYAENLICQLHLHKCMVYMYSGSMVSGGIQFWKCYRQFKSAEAKYPGYDGQLPWRGIFNVLLAQVPEKWKSMAGFLGFGNGNLSLGFKQIEEYRQKVANVEGVGDEALIFSFANMFFSQDQDLSDKLTKIIKANKTPVVTYAYILSCGRRQMGEEAENVLAQVDDQTYVRFPLLYHQRAKYALRRLDPDAALVWAKKFQAVYLGESNKNDAFLQQAYAYLLKGDRTSAKSNVDKCLAIKPNFDIDQRTHDDAARAMSLNVNMLRARLQFEYGNYADALATLHGISPSSNEEREELTFRLARAEDKLGNKSEALRLYNQVISIATNSNRYFGPYAAVYAADIKLAAGDKASAKALALKAKALNTGEYKKELDQRIELLLRAVDK